MNNPLLICALMLFVNANLLTQTNLVYNGDFELFATCPTNLSSPGDFQIEKCLGWSAPTFGTSDYYNECASLFIDIPNNYSGFQTAQNGAAYAGFLAYYPLDFNAGYHWWEYLQDSLSTALIQNHEYYFEMFFSLAEYQSGICSKKIGVYFSSQRILNLTSSTPLNYPAQIKSNLFICDTLNWVKMSGSFIAAGGERYLTIGHFADSVENDTTFLKYSDGEYFPQSYYFVDGVSLIDLSDLTDKHSLHLPNIFTPNDDNVNDLWIPEYKGIKSIEIIILNRWGNIVFKSNKLNDFWDGMCENNKVSDGTYFYVVKFETESSQKNEKSGFIQIINSK